VRSWLSAVIVLASLLPAAAADFGGHEDPQAEAPAPAPADERRATLEEMWQRRLLPPDQNSWSPRDLELLGKIRAVESDALSYLARRPGGSRPWTARPRSGASSAPPRLTKEGYDRYVALLTQDAIAYFEGKGADAKAVFKLRDWNDKPLFDAAGRITVDGMRVYRRARLNLEVFWKSADGAAYGTRRPPTKNP
jgi:hypothetical protein